MLWAQEWAKPQAIVWEELGLEVEVAVYVRTLVLVERNPTATLLGQLRQSQNSLGLTVAGMSGNGWRIDDAGAVAQPSQDKPGASGPTVRDRLKLVG